MLDMIIGTLTQGLIYALLSYGIYITYKILDFPDLTVDGSFPLGAAVTAVLLVKGFNPYLTLLVAMAVGALAGLATGIIHVRLKVRDLLAGIITMTALFSINLRTYRSSVASTPSSPHSPRCFCSARCRSCTASSSLRLSLHFSSSFCLMRTSRPRAVCCCVPSAITPPSSQALRRITAA